MSTDGNLPTIYPSLQCRDCISLRPGLLSDKCGYGTAIPFYQRMIADAQPRMVST
jgi:hypothetical protein